MPARKLSVVKLVFVVLAVAFYAFAGINHFRHPEMYWKIVPPYIPWPVAMVAISGVAEIAGAIGLAIPALRRMAAWGLVALLIAVFPANLYMALHPIEAGAGSLPAWALWARLPFQGLFIWWVLWCTKGREVRSEKTEVRS
jgi:uncharacterized membrane protein